MSLRTAGTILAASLLVAAAGAGRALAHTAEDGLPDFSYRAWTVRDGAPPDVWTLAGGREGVLWLGTGMGLYRFDGLRFERFRPGAEPLPAYNINALLADDDQTLWLGLYEGGVVQVREVGVTRHGAAQGLPGGRVLRLARASGALWAAAAKGLARFDGERWTRIGAAQGFPEAGADYLFRDRQGTLWVSSGERLYRLAAGATRFEFTGVTVGRLAVLAQDGQDRLWLADGRGGVRPLGLPGSWRTWAALPAAAPAPAGGASGGSGGPGTGAAFSPNIVTAHDGRPVTLVKQMLFAGDGGLWVTVNGRGVFRTDAADTARMPPGQQLDWTRGQWFTVADGLGSAITVPLLESDDGEIWVGNNLGVNSLRQRRIRTALREEDPWALGFSVQPEGSGVRMANPASSWHADPPGATTREALPDPRPLPRRPLMQSLRATDGAVWVLDGEALWRFAPEAAGAATRRWQRWPWALPAGVPAVLLAMAADPVGGVWLSLRDAGVFHATPAGLQRVPEAELADRVAPGAIAVDADGAVWFGHDGQLIGLDDRGQRLRFGPEQGLRTGRVITALNTRHGLVVAGENGVALGRDGRFSTLSIERDAAFGRVSGIVESADGDLWLNGGRGLVRLAAADVPSLFIASTHPLSYQLLDAGDGLPGIARQASVLPTAARDARGRLWFVTSLGVVWLDPAQTRRSAREVGVDVQALLAGGQSYPAAQGQQLPEGTRALTLRYAARVLGKAEQVRYRFRLVGVDADWRDAGTQREATYANLGPGDYRFEVLASNPDGLWSRKPTVLAFHIAPTLDQHPAFRWALALALVAAVWGGYRLRVRALQARLRMRLEVRHRERERIARDLHDTLLQGFQGLLLGLDASVRRVADMTLRHRMERDLTRAEALLAEGRDRVGQLRQRIDDEDAEERRERRGRDGDDDQDGGCGAGRGEGRRHRRERDDRDDHRGDGGADGGDGGGGGLVDRLSRAGRDLVRPPGRFRMRVSGTPRALAAAIEDEMLLIAREGLTNAERHARATRVELGLDYRPEAVTLTVRDDGIGLAPDWAARQARGLRYGMCGMQERARLMNAGLTVRGTPGAGTELVLRVADPPRPGWLERWRAGRAAVSP
ncbi:triple tyrosine motif-containing protein [Mitsuaria sp. GD03876]|uniref:sensor histidine kinase n=1 Tax=Mitsuaria sp. GD03876 TaxID=2975399 RepID=UPI002449B1B6|nr:triple tyrosine motif-containing protein [Mitsuaria sp. GD03876]MDH0867737.1 histidine kinase [Mitsuaria sp. GD03876]